jgi:hypothetical protein
MNSKTNKNQMQQRSAHLIDIENLCCESIPTLENVIRAREAYFNKVRPGEDDLFFVTVSSKTNLEAAMFGWGHASISCLEGDDGADILLAKMMLEDDLENRFDKVYLASGDGGLGPFAQALITKGVAVEVVSAPWSLSTPYRFLGAEVSYLWPDYELAA